MTIICVIIEWALVWSGSFRNKSVRINGIKKKENCLSFCLVEMFEKRMILFSFFFWIDPRRTFSSSLSHSIYTCQATSILVVVVVVVHKFKHNFKKTVAVVI